MTSIALTAKREQSGVFVPRLGRRAVILSLACIYVGVLRYAYIALIAPRFSYMRYTYRSPSALTELASLVMLTSPALWLPADCRRPSEMVLWFLYLLVIVPSILIPQYAIALPANEILLLSLVLTVSFHSLVVVPKLPLLSLPRPRLSTGAFWTLFAAIGVALYAVVLLAFGARFNVPSISNIYVTRSAYKAQLDQAGALAGYAVFWLAEVLNPVLLAVSLTRRRYVLAAVAFVGQILLLATTGFKTIAIATVLLAALVVMLRRHGRSLGLWLLGGCNALIVISAGVDWVARTIVFTSVLVRRAIVTPGLLTGMYYEYFSRHPPAMLASSFLRFVADNPYPLPPAQIIGAMYFEGPRTNANANLWADAFANFRYPGMLVMTVALGAVLWILDSLTARLPRRDAFLIVAVPSLALCNTSLQTVFISHGIALILLLSYLMPSVNSQDELRSTPARQTPVAG